MTWFVRTAERDVGPLSEEALRALISTGQVGADTLVCRNGTSDWITTADSGLLQTATSNQVGTAVARSGEPVTPESSADPSLGIPATPWRRFWARALDTLVDGALIGVTIGVVRPSLIQDLGGWGQMLLDLPCGLLVDCVLYGVFGSTPGKAVAGIRVVSDVGEERLTFRAYFRRNVEIYIFGFGLGLPLINLVALYRSYRKLAQGETLSWDQYAESKVLARSQSWIRTSVVAVVYVSLLGGALLLGRRAAIEEGKQHALVLQVQARIRAEESLRSTARDINKMGPMFVRSDNRFDSAKAGPGLMFTYEYTMTAMRRSQLSSPDLERFRQSEQDRLFTAACRGSLIRMMMTAEILRAHYSDRDGVELATAEVKRADCGWRQ